MSIVKSCIKDEGGYILTYPAAVSLRLYDAPRQGESRHGFVRLAEISTPDVQLARSISSSLQNAAEDLQGWVRGDCDIWFEALVKATKSAEQEEG